MPTGQGSQPAKVLTIAGSDSGGAAGLQADLKTFTALGVYGMSAITAVTAQNSLRVEGVHYIPAEFVTAQIEAVLADYGAASIKTGFIGRAKTIQSIASVLEKQKREGQFHLVVDPVLVNHKGESMFPASVAKAYAQCLLPLADLVTPNLAEGKLFTGLPVTSLATMETVARRIQRLGSQWVLVKGARSGSKLVDLLFDGQEALLLDSPFIDSLNTHGSGDTLSAAICAFMAQGSNMVEAVERARDFTLAAIRGSIHWQLGGGHGPLNHL
jgi:hydroxymethylpyrimidine/phosphomethylpyrimidine kinase